MDPLRHRMFDAYLLWYAKKVIFFRWIVGIGMVLGAGGVYYTYTYAAPPAQKTFFDTFVTGFVPDKFTAIDAPARADVPRKELHGKLLALLRPTAVTCTYAVIVGEHGTGKSTAVRNAARAKGTDGANGVVYFEIGDVSHFSIDLISCLNATVPEIDWRGAVRRRVEATTKDEAHVDLSKEPLETWLTITRPLEAAAMEFYQKYNRPMTLVIDGVHKFVDKDSAAPHFLHKLQDFAKDAATTGNLQVVFVSSDKTALVHMQGNSSWSRAGTPFEIGDIDDKDAADFLVRRSGLDQARATELVRDVTGGRFALLLKADASTDVAATRKQKYTATDTMLKQLGLSPTHPFFTQLVASKCIDTNKALDVLEKEKIEALLTANVIAARANGTYVAHSRHVETFLENSSTSQQALTTPGLNHLLV